MKKLPLIALLAVLSACNSAPSSPAAAPAKSGGDSAAAVKPIKSPYEIMYSSKFEIDDPKNAETLLALWKVYDDGDLSKGKEMIADSIEMHFANGAMVKASRDSATAMVQ